MFKRILAFLLFLFFISFKSYAGINEKQKKIIKNAKREEDIGNKLLE